MVEVTSRFAAGLSRSSSCSSSRRELRGLRVVGCFRRERGSFDAMGCSGGGRNAGGDCRRVDRPLGGGIRAGRRHTERGGGARGKESPFACAPANRRAEGAL